MHPIEAQQVTKVFKGKRGSIVNALSSLDLTVECGDIFGFLGPNGAGKSTTIKCLMGLIKPDSGTASVMGQPAGSVASRVNVGYLPENPSFYDFLSAEEYLRFVGETYRMPGDILKKRIDDSLTLLELESARRRPMRTYSKGMVQRVGLAQTMIHDPDLYILDEPMSGLDPLGRALVKQIISELKSRGKTVFFSTHIIDDVEKICNKVGILLKGELKFVDTVNSVINQGVVGYQIISRTPGRDETVEKEINKEHLLTYLDQLKGSGDEILMVQPQRLSLESFFLSVVNKSDCQDIS